MSLGLGSVRIVKRKMVVSSSSSSSSRPTKQSKTAQHKYICVSKDVDNVEYYYTDENEEEAAAAAEADADDDNEDDGLMDSTEDDSIDTKFETFKTFKTFNDAPPLYENVYMYNNEDYYGFPRLIHGVVYYVDTSNFVFDFRTKELLGKYHSEHNTILFWREAVAKKQKYDYEDEDEDEYHDEGEEEIKVIF